MPDSVIRKQAELQRQTGPLGKATARQKYPARNGKVAYVIACTICRVQDGKFPWSTDWHRSRTEFPGRSYVLDRWIAHAFRRHAEIVPAADLAGKSISEVSRRLEIARAWDLSIEEDVLRD